MWRDGVLRLDNGHCRGTELVSYFVGRGPSRNADCKPNEVDIPRVVGMSLTAGQAAGSRAAAVRQRSSTSRAGRSSASISSSTSFPRKGRLSSYDTVTLVLAKPLHGVVPKVVGLSLRNARRRLRARGLVPVIERFADGRAGRVLAQMPVAGVAAGAAA